MPAARRPPWRPNRAPDRSMRPPVPAGNMAESPGSPRVARMWGWSRGCRHMIIRGLPFARTGLPHPESNRPVVHRPQDLPAGWLLRRSSGASPPDARALSPRHIRLASDWACRSERRCFNKKQELSSFVGNHLQLRQRKNIGSTGRSHQSSRRPAKFVVPRLTTFDAIADGLRLFTKPRGHGTSPARGRAARGTDPSTRRRT